MICPTCGRILTGSKSKGRAQDYFYYHCARPCKVRFRAEYTNDLFVRELKKFIPRTEYLDVYKVTIRQAWHDETKHVQDDKRQLSNQITELEGRLVYLRELLATQKIDPEDYRNMKAEYTEKIEKLLAKLASSTQNPVNLDGLLNTGMSNLINLENLYQNGDIVRKREITGSIFPEKFTFNGFHYRTARLNEAVSLIFSLGAGFRAQKKQDKSENFVLSCEVTLSGFKQGSKMILKMN